MFAGRNADARSKRLCADVRPRLCHIPPAERELGI